MAIKKSFNDGNFNWNDVLDTQDALDKGILGSTTAGKMKSTTTNKLLIGPNDVTSATYDIQANKDTLGSLLSLGGVDASTGIAAYKKRKLEQTNLANQGVGQSQSILGGGIS